MLVGLLKLLNGCFDVTTKEEYTLNTYGKTDIKPSKSIINYLNY